MNESYEITEGITRRVSYGDVLQLDEQTCNFNFYHGVFFHIMCK
jgi:hypothetical protein